jgi:uncharacterized protein
MKRFLCLLLILLTCLYWPGSDSLANDPKPSQFGNPIISLRLNRTVVQAEVVSSPEKLYLGLSGRPSLAPGTGMLFVMPSLEVQVFCMRDMRFAIDIIWLARNRIIGFHRNLPPNETETYTSPGPADLVLEVPAGFAAAAGMKVGDRLKRLP